MVLDEEVFRHFTMFDILKRRRQWRSPVTFALIMGVCSLFCFLMHQIQGAVFLGVVLLVVGLGMPVVYFSTFFVSLAKQVKAQNLEPPRFVYALDLDEKPDGIRITNGNEHATYVWKNVYHVWQDKKCTYLYITGNRAFLLPHACLSENASFLWSFLITRLGAERCSVV